MILVRALVTLLVAVIVAPNAMAQDKDKDKERLPIFAADVRLSFPNFKHVASVATDLGVASADLPGHGLGLAFGGHVYPFRKGLVTFGFGGEIVTSHGSNTVEPTSATAPQGPTLRTEFSSVAPQVSLNFGKREGWSYLSAGLGSARLTTEREDRPPTASAPRVKALNYGGGARWFARKHLAVSLDLRFYQINAQEPVGTRPAYPKVSMVVMSGGVGFK